MRQSCAELLETYTQQREIHQSEKLVFKGISGLDVYNITAPLWGSGGRVHPRAGGAPGPRSIPKWWPSASAMATGMQPRTYRF